MTTFEIIRCGEVVATVQAETKRDAQIAAAQRFGDGPWVRPRP